MIEKGGTARAAGDLGLARALHQEALELARGMDHAWSVYYALHELGCDDLEERSDAQAQERLTEALALARGLGNADLIANTLDRLPAAVQPLAGAAAARAHLCESLRLRSGRRERTLASLRSFARAAQTSGELSRAAKLLGAAGALQEKLGAPVPYDEVPDHERTVCSVRESLDDASFAAAWEAGRAMSPEEATAYALDDPAASS